MKTLKKDLILALFFGLILPGMLLNLLKVPRKYPTVTEFTSVGEGETVVKVNIPILVRNEDGEVEEMDLDAYIVGVVLAEMPASFDSESKKAQAVAARTFALRAKMTGGKHGDGTVCVSSGCCQAYTTVEDYYGRGGKSENVTSAEEAVLATSGQVLTYENELIQATYFSCSGGSTEDAVAVWGSDVPYLRAKESPGEEEAKYHTDEVIFTAEEFNEALGTSLSGDPGKWFGMTTYTSGDGVATMQIGEKTYSVQIRSAVYSIFCGGGFRGDPDYHQRFRSPGGHEPVWRRCHGGRGQRLPGDSGILLSWNAVGSGGGGELTKSLS